MLSKRMFPSKISNGMMITFLCILLVSAIFIVAVFGSKCTREKFTTEETKPTSAEAASASDKDIKLPAKPASASTNEHATPATDIVKPVAAPAVPAVPTTPAKPTSTSATPATPTTPATPKTPATTTASTSALSSKETDLFQDIVDNKLSAEQITKMIKEGFITEKLVDKFMDTLKSKESSSKVVEPFSNYADSNYAEYASF